MVFSKQVVWFGTLNFWRSDEEKAVAFLKPGKLLIAGVGGGRTITPLIAKGFSVIGLDILPQMLQAARYRHPSIPVICADMQRTPFANAIFDSIYIPWHAICYVDHVETTLREMHRLLRPGGTLLFNMPNNWYWKEGPPWWGRRWQRADRNRPDYLAASYGSMLRKRSFRKIFSFVEVRARVLLQDADRLNWEERILCRLPFFDRSLYFFCKKSG